MCNAFNVFSVIVTLRSTLFCSVIDLRAVDSARQIKLIWLNYEETEKYIQN
jgi:hypothetical protein